MFTVISASPVNGNCASASTPAVRHGARYYGFSVVWSRSKPTQHSRQVTNRFLGVNQFALNEVTHPTWVFVTLRDLQMGLRFR
jgi:hypothetical protein